MRKIPIVIASFFLPPLGGVAQIQEHSHQAVRPGMVLRKVPTAFVQSLLVLFSVCILGARAQPVQPPGIYPAIGAVVQAWHYDAAANVLSIQVLNTSHKDVTAYSLSVFMKYTDGSTSNFKSSVDLLPLIINTGATFPPGASRDELFPQSKDIVDVEAFVEVVAYADSTADVLDDRAFNQLVADRKGDLLAMQKTNEILNQVLSDPSVKNPSTLVANQLKKFAEALNPRDLSEAYEKSSLPSVAEHLRGAVATAARLKLTETDYLKRLVKDQEQQIAEAAPHTQLARRAGGWRIEF